MSSITVTVTVPVDEWDSRFHRWEKVSTALRRAATDASYHGIYDTTEVAGERENFEGTLKWTVAVEEKS